MRSWYIKKADGSLYGPHPLEHLVLWAKEARVEPTDQLSSDRVTWQPADSVPELELDYIILLPDDHQYGPIHQETLIELVHEGELPSSTPVRHRLSGLVHEAGYWIAEALLATRDRPVPATDIVTPETPAVSTPAWETEPSGDVAKWQQLFETEQRERNAEREELTSALAHAKQAFQEAANARDRFRFQLRQAEDRLAALGETSQEENTANRHATRETELVAAYDRLQKQYETTVDTLEKEQQKVAKLEHDLADRTEALHRVTQTSASERDAVRTQLDGLQQDLETLKEEHQSLLKKYRELNDQYFKLKTASSEPT